MKNKKSKEVVDEIKEGDVVGRHVYEIGPHVNSGESVYIETEIFWNGDPDGTFLNQKVILQSYGNSASINLFGSTLTPQDLRAFANELEVAILNAKAKLPKE